MRKFKITQVFGRCFSSWIEMNDSCAICRNDLNEPSIEIHLTKFNSKNNFYLKPEDSKIIGVGNCHHCFHIDCIEKWLLRVNTCPLCFLTWKYKKIVHINS